MERVKNKVQRAKNESIFRYLKLSTMAGFKYDKIRMERLSPEETENIRKVIEKEASTLLKRKYKLIAVEEQDGACSGDCISCKCNLNE